LLATAAALVAAGGCAHRVTPAPSAAVAEVRERLAAHADGAPSGCAASPAAFEAAAPFAYAESGLTEEGRDTLQALVAWLRCHADATVAISVANEPHYRRPEQEAALRKDRLAAATAWLREAGIAEARIRVVSSGPDADTAAPADAARLTLRGRGW
jgi:hypothetical protein